MLSNGGIVADTPGFNQPSLEAVSPQSLPLYFPEVQQRLAEGRCLFKDCRHLQEPGCIVRGEWERYPLYTALLSEVEEKDRLMRQRSVSKKSREGTIRLKSESGGVQRAEALLDRKKHRRQSRKKTKQKFQQDIMGDDFHDYD
uniref:Ribosome biogenesis GTPase n=3 Tax=Tetraselmis sp. GSL018 TaxID=582737 RepID=A0A061RKD7_9CHLO